MTLKQLKKQYPYSLSVLKKARELAETSKIGISQAIEAIAKQYAEGLSNNPVPYEVFGVVQNDNGLAVASLKVETPVTARSVYIHQLAEHFAAMALLYSEKYVKNMEMFSVIARCGENVQINTVRIITRNKETSGWYNHLGKYAACVILSAASEKTDCEIVAQTAQKLAIQAVSYYPRYLEQSRQKQAEKEQSYENYLPEKLMRAENHDWKPLPLISEFLDRQSAKLGAKIKIEKIEIFGNFE